MLVDDVLLNSLHAEQTFLLQQVAKIWKRLFWQHDVNVLLCHWNGFIQGVKFTLNYCICECYTLRHIYAYFLDSKVSAYTLKIAISNSAATLFGKVFYCKQSLTQIQGYSKNQNGEERHCCGFERSMVVRSSRADLSISNANFLLLSYSPKKKSMYLWCTELMWQTLKGLGPTHLILV